MARKATTTKPAAPRAPKAPAAGSNLPKLTDKALIAAADEFYSLNRDVKKGEARLKELRTTLLTAMGDAPTAYAGARVLTRSDVVASPATPDRTITKDMVGQMIPGNKGRSGYTTLSVG